MTPTPFLLPLSTIHAADPGALAVLFGRDGDFDGAPKFRCALWTTAANEPAQWIDSGPHGLHFQLRRYVHRRELVSDMLISGLPGRVYIASEVALDLRVPSVAARVAGLCARALAMQYVGIGNREWEANRQTCIAAQLGISPDLDPGLPARLASLFLALSARIAALGVTP